MKILVIRLSSMGDVIIQSSLVRFIKERYSGAKISFLTSKEFASLVEKNPDIDQVLKYHRKNGFADLREMMRIARVIRQIKPDLVFDLHNNTRSNIISFFAGVPTLRVDKRSWKRNFLVKFKKDLLSKELSQHSRTLSDFAACFKAGEVSDYLDDSNKLTQISNSHSDKRKIISISPVASFSSKRWPIEYFQELINKITNDSELDEFNIEIIAGPNDSYCAELGRDNARVDNLQGKTSLEQTIEKISSSVLCVTNDTGSLHIAESFNVPCIAFFGPTSPSFGFRPHLEKSEYFYRKVACSPCSKTGSKACTQEKHICMLEITPDAVYSKIKEKLSCDLSSV